MRNKNNRINLASIAIQEWLANYELRYELEGYGSGKGYAISKFDGRTIPIRSADFNNRTVTMCAQKTRCIISRSQQEDVARTVEAYAHERFWQKNGRR